MKNNIIIVVSLALILTAGIIVVSAGHEQLALAVKKKKNTTQFLTYENPQYKYSLSYPKDWNKIEFLGVLTVFTPKHTQPGEVKPAGGELIVGILKQANDTIDHHITNTINTLKQKSPDFFLIKRTPRTLGGNPAQEIIFTQTVLQESISKQQDIKVFTIRNGTGYDLTFHSLADNFDINLPTVRKIIDSFQFTS